FRRIDGVSGKAKESVMLPPGCNSNGSWGAVVDASGIAWVTPNGPGKLCYFSTLKAGVTGTVRDPQWGAMKGDGIALDRDQNLWVGLDVARYTPDRSNGTVNLGNGWWAHMGGINGFRIATDSRSAQSYYAWSCTGNGVVQIPASSIKVMKSDQQVMNP